MSADLAAATSAECFRHAAFLMMRSSAGPSTRPDGVEPPSGAVGDAMAGMGRSRRRGGERPLRAGLRRGGGHWRQRDLRERERERDRPRKRGGTNGNAREVTGACVRARGVEERKEEG